MLVELAPKPEPVDSRRKLPSKKPTATTQPELTAATPQPSRKPEGVQPITPERTSYRFTAGREFDALYLEARALLSHQCPQGRMEEVLREALKLLVASKTAKKVRPTAKAPTLRQPTQAAKQVVYQRDDKHCQYVAPDGRRCTETRFLEYDHIMPAALGGRSTVENLRLYCSCHNRWRAAQTFGEFRGVNTKRTS